MIYTMGHTKTYLIALKEFGKDLKKLGFKEKYKDGEDYTGGCCFKTVREAYEYILLEEALGNIRKGEYSVFSLDCDWDNTIKIDSDLYNNLIEDAVILGKVEI